MEQEIKEIKQTQDDIIRYITKGKCRNSRQLHKFLDSDKNVFKYPKFVKEVRSDKPVIRNKRDYYQYLVDEKEARKQERKERERQLEEEAAEVEKTWKRNTDWTY